MFLINGIIPLSNEKHRLPDPLYKAIGEYEHHLGTIELVKRGKATKPVFKSLGKVDAAVRGPAIMLTSTIESFPEDCPYIRLVFNINKNCELDTNSINFVFSKEPGELTSSNYTVTNIS